MKAGTVFLVGAGPGDPGLVTVRGLELVRGCDVLVYDNLMADEIVAESGAAEKIYVGKAAGRHMMTQERIGRVLVEKAREGKRVVRLKGGDPFVFGRGGEECQALARASVPYVVVPGITSGLAGPACAGIPVTHRDESRGVTLVTGHFSKDQSVDLPWKALAGLGHTLVVYMAVSALERVVEGLIDAGMDGETGAALIEQATTAAQRTIEATLGSIPSVALREKVKPPALLVVGSVVGLGSELAWLPVLPLAGRTVLFTRAADHDYEAVERLRSLGAKVVDVPVVRIVPRTPDAEILDVVRRIEALEAVAFTSTAAVDLFFEALRAGGRDARALAGRLVVPATRSVGRSLERRGLVPDVDPDEARAGGVARVLAERLAGGSRVLLPRSSAAGADVVEEIRAAGLEPVPLVLYDIRNADLGWLSVKASGRQPDAVVFLSGSGVDAVLDAVPGLAAAPSRPLWACVGRVTARALEARGIRPDLVPATPDVDLMIDDLIRKISGPA